MKRTVLLFITTILYSSVLFAQDSERSCIPLIGDKAPAFLAKSTLGDINFPEDYYAKWKILFSHPADFTPVCTSELITLATMEDEFKELNTALIVLSTDGLNSHIDWVKSIESIKYKGNDPVKISFPIVTDVHLNVSRAYGMIHPSASKTTTIRAVFIIDDENIIRAIFYYPSEVGRNLEEIKRTLIALQTSSKHNVLTPANWACGDDVLLRPPASIQEAEKLEAKRDKDLYSPVWYMWFKKFEMN